MVEKGSDNKKVCKRKRMKITWQIKEKRSLNYYEMLLRDTNNSSKDNDLMY